MKKTFGFLTFCATLALLSLPVFANTTPSIANGTLQEPAQDAACSSDAKIALYATVTAEISKDQAKAYEAAKKYVACPSEGADDAEQKRVTYLKNFIAKFEKARRKDQLTSLIGKKDYPAAFETGKQIFADDPTYLKGYLDLSLAGAISQNQALSADTITYARKAIEMIEGGAAPADWKPFESKDDALAKLNYVVGSLAAANNPDLAIVHLIKAASYNSKIKTTALTYGYLAEAYEHGPYAKQSADYKTNFGGKDETPESKLALENINQIIDRQIDAYARAVALAGTDPNKSVWMAALTDWYKFRNNKSDAGLNELIAGVLNKPLPGVPTPITSLPTPAATPSATGTSTNGAATPAVGTTVQPKPAVTTPTASKSTPGKPKKAHVKGN
ncbi:MAG TPA: hypothetical protein VGN86_08445 [Pyrinomonadaceae bacterium]|nr:hypothetical protein [Pyrinomonadaceae bacterium]